MKKILLLLIGSVFFYSVFAVAETSSKDHEIVAFMIVLNKNEIAVANITKQKKVSHDVANFADLMLKEHNKNLTNAEKLSTEQKIEPINTEMVVSLEEKGKEEINLLTPLINKKYETTYIDAMVKGHTDALTNINSFLKKVKNPKLKKYLEDTRTHVQYHLAKARAIQKKLQK